MGSSPNPFKAYLQELRQKLATGAAQERAHRSALQHLLESMAGGVQAVNEPKREDCGAPDFAIFSNSLTVGYVETKDIGQSLDAAEQTDQLQRYRRYLGNLVLTDYLEFRWYVDGECRDKVELARRSGANKIVLVKDGEQRTAELLESFLANPPQSISTPADLALRMARLTHLIRDIIAQAFGRHKESALLADLRDAFAKSLIPDIALPEKTGEFADMYAQTIAYGLFTARCNHQGSTPFQRLGAAANIPKANPFLRKLFETMTGADLQDEPYVGFVDDLTQLLAHADIDSVLADFGKRAKQQDPMVHFYETFLAAYDPDLREKRGVYYTPEPVVSYLVRSVDWLLRHRFQIPQGLMDKTIQPYEPAQEGQGPSQVPGSAHRVLVLDPACGTGTFLYAVVDRIRDQFGANAGMWAGYVKQHLLPRLFGFELMMAPYAVAHLKLGLQLAGWDMSVAQRAQWAYNFAGDERLGIYLTNTLEETEKAVQTLFGSLRTITEEANAAGRVKRDLPIMVVLGNPPYSGQSANRSEVQTNVGKGDNYVRGWVIGPNGRTKPDYAKATRDLGFRPQPTFIGRLVRDYYVCDGQWVQERNMKWLQDDYVKFIRWAQWRIEQTGSGILAFITNHGYLDNPTFRGMRWVLLNTFSEIYLLNLHGNAQKHERAPDGSKDENVFDISIGVTIGIFVKEPGKTGPAQVHYADLWGVREVPNDPNGGKYPWLLAHDVSSPGVWTTLAPHAPFYFFVPQAIAAGIETEYHQGWKVTDIFPVHSVGVVTARDSLTIHWSKGDVWKTVSNFATLPAEDAREGYALGPDRRDWKVSLAQADLKATGPSRDRITPILYRPFDTRFTYYTGQTRGFLCMPRPEVMRHMLGGENTALITSRMTKGETFRHAQVTHHIVEVICMSPKTSNNGFVFPLYLYPAAQHKPGEQKELLSSSPWPVGKDGRVPNLAPSFATALGAKLGLAFVSDGYGDLATTFGPEDVLRYIYAILHAPTYRSRYAELLRRDFPYVPLTSDLDLFRKLCELGRELITLHLLEPPPTAGVPTYPAPGTDVVTKGYPKYVAAGEPEPGTGTPLPHGRVYINPDQYFDGVPADVWAFQVGGYQVCAKWLRDRQERSLSFDEQEQYSNIVAALKETIRLMTEIDAAIPGWPIG